MKIIATDMLQKCANEAKIPEFGKSLADQDTQVFVSGRKRKKICFNFGGRSVIVRHTRKEGLQLEQTLIRQLLQENPQTQEALTNLYKQKKRKKHLTTKVVDAPKTLQFFPITNEGKISIHLQKDKKRRPSKIWAEPNPKFTEFCTKILTNVILNK